LVAGLGVVVVVAASAVHSIRFGPDVPKTGRDARVVEEMTAITVAVIRHDAMVD
jgi:hypothetical protein